MKKKTVSVSFSVVSVGFALLNNKISRCGEHGSAKIPYRFRKDSARDSQTETSLKLKDFIRYPQTESILILQDSVCFSRTESNVKLNISSI